ncbi:helix-turn-helix transcriptional regulator [Thermoanaerobacterium sp. DL9XJH110]|uniref:helix-turn-helix transcriptional regulator n=1 Tax=Thermoanaerobacterium sp. DL9XJH110 TaxID=3386643 RepID=UPI003BB738AC
MEAKENRLKAYIPMVDFIAGIMGPDCEVVLHDTSNPEHSIVAIKNNHISGRQVGGPLTDLGLKILKEGAYENQDYLLNYPSKTRDGKPLRSSTFFIKDSSGRLTGMLCINIDLTAAISARKFIENYITGGRSEAVGMEPSAPDLTPHHLPEHFSSSIEELVYTIIEKTINDLNLPPERLSPEEKMNIVQQLNEKGVFLLKGAVSEVAKHLKVSENTIYRYLNKKD